MQYDFIEELENIALRDDENNEVFEDVENDQQEEEDELDENSPPKEGQVRLVDGRTPYEV